MRAEVRRCILLRRKIHGRRVLARLIETTVLEEEDILDEAAKEVLDAVGDLYA